MHPCMVTATKTLKRRQIKAGWRDSPKRQKARHPVGMAGFRQFGQERVPYGEAAFVVAGAKVEVAGARSPL